MSLYSKYKSCNTLFSSQFLSVSLNFIIYWHLLSKFNRKTRLCMFLQMHLQEKKICLQNKCTAGYIKPSLPVLDLLPAARKPGSVGFSAFMRIGKTTKNPGGKSYRTKIPPDQTVHNCKSIFTCCNESFISTALFHVPM